MKNLFFSVLLFLGFASVCAQNQLFVEATELHDGIQKTYGYAKDSRIDGSPYVDEDTTVGVFYQPNNLIVKTPARLNCYYNTFEYMANGKTYLLNGHTVDSVRIRSDTYVFKAFAGNGVSALCAVKVEARYRSSALYRYRGVELKPEVKPAGYVEPRPARFEWMDPVYLFETDSQLFVLKSMKDVLAIMPHQKENIKKYIKENRINWGKSDKLKQLFGFISGLVINY